MNPYRAKPTGHDTAKLQRRRLLIFWETIAYGPAYSMITRAISLTRIQNSTFKIHNPKL